MAGSKKLRLNNLCFQKRYFCTHSYNDFCFVFYFKILQYQGRDRNKVKYFSNVGLYWQLCKKEYYGKFICFGCFRCSWNKELRLEIYSDLHVHGTRNTGLDFVSNLVYFRTC